MLIRANVLIRADDGRCDAILFIPEWYSVDDVAAWGPLAAIDAAPDTTRPAHVRLRLPMNVIPPCYALTASVLPEWRRPIMLEPWRHWRLRLLITSPEARRPVAWVVRTHLGYTVGDFLRWPDVEAFGASSTASPDARLWDLPRDTDDYPTLSLRADSAPTWAVGDVTIPGGASDAPTVTRMETLVRLRALCTVRRLPDEALLARYIDVAPVHGEPLSVTCAERLRAAAEELLAACQTRPCLCRVVLWVMYGVACGAPLAEIATPDIEDVMDGKV
ncbi:MAG: hypothetical protein LBS56_09460 [Propionibacteriaceae bacterium]|jgi:hypothetical protein|nr:hypothetical protein [Propionibacteriaceae bacterium]